MSSTTSFRHSKPGHLMILKNMRDAFGGEGDEFVQCGEVPSRRLAPEKPSNY